MTARGWLHMRWGWAVVVLAALAAGYFFLNRRMTTQPQPPTTAASASGSRSNSGLSVPAVRPPSAAVPNIYPIAADGTVAVPMGFQLPGVSRVRAGSASSFQEWLALYPVPDQKTISEYSKRHFGVYSINSPQQIAWMALNGYPMPEDIIAAQTIADGDLRKLARNGNEKAGFLLRERDLDMLKARYREDAATGLDFWQDDPDAPQMRQDQGLTTQLMQRSNSPFKGYVQAQDSILSNDSEDAAATIIGGLFWAASLGDFRAVQFLQTYVGSDPIRIAIGKGAEAVGVNRVQDLIKMERTGCVPTGVAQGMYIPDPLDPVN